MVTKRPLIASARYHVRHGAENLHRAAWWPASPWRTPISRVADESPGHGNFSPESLGGTVRMVLVAADPDAV